MLNDVNFLFALVVFVFMVGNAFTRRTEGRKSASTVAFILAGCALVICIWNHVARGNASSHGYPSNDSSRILTRLDSLDAHVHALRQDIDVMGRRVWYLSRGQEQAEILKSMSDTLRTPSPELTPGSE